jgi:FKBP-type peptidyl-prolyl cis-trans isomerase
MNKALWALVIIIVLGALGAGAYYSFKKPTSPATPEQAQQGQQAPADQVQAQEVKVGDGAPATPGMMVAVLYEGKLSDGTTFDSSAAHGNQPLVFQLGEQGLIPGFQIGVNGMKVGGERVLSIPPALGYGAQDVKDASGKVIIPANSTLLFDVKLVDVRAASSTPTATPTAPAKK